MADPTKPDAEQPKDPEFDYHGYWQDELKRRAERRDRGEGKDVPWDEVKRAMRAPLDG